MTKPTAPIYGKQYIILPEGFGSEEGLAMNAYQRAAQSTDKMPAGFEMPILGLFGEVGSLLSALKKKMRDAGAFPRYDQTIIEELGDVLWYFTNIATRAELELSVLAQRVFRDYTDWDEIQSDKFGTFGDIQTACKPNLEDSEFSQRIFELASKVGDLVREVEERRLEENRDKISGHLVDIFRALLSAAEAADVGLDSAAYGNLRKTYSRWPTREEYPPLVDQDMPKDEQLPRQLAIYIEEQETNGRTFVLQKCRGIIIGDRLTDNKIEKDDYRFHDVFHLAFAAYLGWSPVLRRLFKVKRKSDPEIDENEDGARAALIEEGVSTFIFSRGLERKLFKNIGSVDYDLLKSIQELIKGYEVERCGLWQWEKAILEGFRVFRQLQEKRRGFVVADLADHTLDFMDRDPYER